MGREGGREGRREGGRGQHFLNACCSTNPKQIRALLMLHAAMPSHSSSLPPALPSLPLSLSPTCNGCSSCIICLSETKSHCEGNDKPVSLSLMPINSFTLSCWL